MRIMIRTVVTCDFCGKEVGTQWLELPRYKICTNIRYVQKRTGKDIMCYRCESNLRHMLAEYQEKENERMATNLVNNIKKICENKEGEANA